MISIIKLNFVCFNGDNMDESKFEYDLSEIKKEKPSPKSIAVRETMHEIMKKTAVIEKMDIHEAYMEAQIDFIKKKRVIKLIDPDSTN